MLSLLWLATACATDRVSAQLDVGATSASSGPNLTVASDCAVAWTCSGAFDGVQAPTTRWDGRAGWGGGGTILVSERLLPRLHLDFGFDLHYVRAPLSPVEAFTSPAHPGISYAAPGTGGDLFFSGLPLLLRWTAAPGWDLYAGVVPGILVLQKRLVASTGPESLLTGGGFDAAGRLGIERTFGGGLWGVGLYGQADSAGLFDGAFADFALHFGTGSAPGGAAR